MLRTFVSCRHRRLWLGNEKARHPAVQTSPEFTDAGSVTTTLPVLCCGRPLEDYVSELRELAIAAAEEVRRRHPEGGADPTVVIEINQNTLFTLDTRRCAQQIGSGGGCAW